MTTTQSAPEAAQKPKRMVRVRKRLSPTTQRGHIIDGVSWSMVNRLVTLALTWFVSIITANYLGSSDFGKLTFAYAYVSLFTMVMSAGLSGLVVKDLVKKQEEQQQILGTVFGIRLIASFVSMGIVYLTTWKLNVGPPGSHNLVLIIALSMIAGSNDVINFWFQSITRLRATAVMSLVTTFLGVGLRIGLVAMEAPLQAFAWATLVETAVGTWLLFIAFKRAGGTFRRWKFETNRARQYLSRSWPLILSGAANAINLKMDQVLLGTIAGASAAGTYAVAARLSEVWYFLPTTIAGVVFPSIVRAKQRGEQDYRQLLRKLYGMFAWMAIAVAIVMTFLAQPLIRTVYDPDFWEAANILIIHVWTAPFLFMSVVFSKWLITEELLKMSLIRHGFGAALNVVLNLLWIPDHGPIGSAYATLVSYAAATYLACFLRRRTWPVAVDMTRGLLAPVEFVYKFVTTKGRTSTT